MKGPSWSLSADLKTVTVDFPSTPPVSLVFASVEVDRTLKNLGDYRMAMTPEVPRSAPSTPQVEVISDPIWQTEPEMLEGNTILHIRDPRFGWLNYMLPRDEARKLATTILNQANSPEPGLASGKAN